MSYVSIDREGHSLVVKPACFLGVSETLGGGDGFVQEFADLERVLSVDSVCAISEMRRLTKSASSAR